MEGGGASPLGVAARADQGSAAAAPASDCRGAAGQLAAAGPAAAAGSTSRTSTSSSTAGQAACRGQAVPQCLSGSRLGTEQPRASPLWGARALDCHRKPTGKAGPVARGCPCSIASRSDLT